VSFRDAHSAVGSLVRECEAARCELSALPPASFAAAHPLFDDGSLAWLAASNSLARREIPGGTGPGAVAAQLDAAREKLSGAGKLRG
jgi:argininosuccinate lyase